MFARLFCIPSVDGAHKIILDSVYTHIDTSTIVMHKDMGSSDRLCNVGVR